MFICSLFIQHVSAEFLVCPVPDLSRGDVIVLCVSWRASEISGGDRAGHCIQLCAVVGTGMMSSGSRTILLGRHYPVGSFSICH